MRDIFNRYFSVTQEQWIKGLIVAVIGSVLGLIITTLQNGGLLNWKGILMYGLISGLSYVAKALGTDSSPGSLTKGKFLGKV